MPYLRDTGKAIDHWRREGARANRHAAVVSFAAAAAGTALDLDPGLESAAVEYLVRATRREKLNEAKFS
jgi:hypothetical protein